MKDTTRTMLNLIDTYLADASPDDAKELWAVLSAFRGPDTSVFDKTTTTSIVRTAALPKTAAKAYGSDGLYYTRFGAEVAKGGPTTIRVKQGYGHFINHIRHAAEVLGLPLYSDEYEYDGDPR